MGRRLRHKNALSFMNYFKLFSDGDACGAFDDDPVFAAVVVELEAELRLGLYGNPFDLVAGALFEHSEAAPGAQ